MVKDNSYYDFGFKKYKTQLCFWKHYTEEYIRGGNNSFPWTHEPDYIMY